MRNLSPNQFALPGMEHLAHPGARHVAQGVSFHMDNRRVAGETTEGFAALHRHTLIAHTMSPDTFEPDAHIGNALGHIEWAGKDDTFSKYPGQINMVERAYGASDMKAKTKGLMTDMYHMGHQMDMGQSTVPVHSPERTSYGESWSKKVGGPRPKRGEDDWKPPRGIHPYERNAGAQFKRYKPMQGEQPLFHNTGEDPHDPKKSPWTPRLLDMD